MTALLDIVSAMRSLAGMRVQEALRKLPAARRYADDMAAAIGGALQLLPETRRGASAQPEPRAIILCAAEHGFVGGFNERLIEAAQAVLSRGDQLLVIGSRGAHVALERNVCCAWTDSMATQAEGLPETIRRLATELYLRIARGEIARVEVLYARSRAGQRLTIERRTVIPVDLDSLAGLRPLRPPVHYLEPGELLEKLTEEYVVALLIEAAIETLASENAARFSATDAAHENVTKRLDRLRAEAHQASQSEITAELLDVVTGAEALAGG